MKKAGALTIVQDESTSLVYGMSRHAIENDAAEIISPLPDIPRIILQYL
jgi:chemotaxis response regulator CheB